MYNYLKRFVAVLLLAGLLFGIMPSMEVQADIYDTADLIDAEWAVMGDIEIAEERGWPQSVCVTDKYIVCLINNSSKEAIPDTLMAFNRSDYSYAFEVTERDYEHGNGMAYNPKTNCLYIVTGPVLDKSNRGNIYVVDADTLTWQSTHKVGNGKEIFSGIGYVSDKDCLVLSGGSNNSFVEIDADFNVVDTLMNRYKIPGLTVQDICATGDYIIAPFYDNNTRLDNYFVVYSISERAYLDTIYAYFPGNESQKEVESISEASDGTLVVAVGIPNPRRIRLYSAKLRASYGISTSAENGSITADVQDVAEGTDYQLSFQPNEHYELASLIVDGEEVESEPKQTEYMLHSISGDHTVKAIFTEIPQFMINTGVSYGSISPTASIYRDESYTVTYAPKEHFELKQVLVDGKNIDKASAQTAYTFEDIQTEHSIQVKFTEIPSWQIQTDVRGGTITGPIYKAYRDSTQNITYEPDKDHVLLYVKVDGEYMDKDKFADSYQFTDIAGAHAIEVVYIWKYVPACIVGVLLFIAFLVFYSNLVRRRKKARRKNNLC